MDTALLRVNKQIFDEASSIFYAENTFRFPEALFVGAPILQQLQTLYRVSRVKLKMMRSVVLDVPVCLLFFFLSLLCVSFGRSGQISNNGHFAYLIGVRLHYQPPPSPPDCIQPSASDRVLGVRSENESAIAVGICVGRKLSISWTQRLLLYFGRRCPQSAVEGGGHGYTYQNASEIHGRVG